MMAPSAREGSYVVWIQQILEAKGAAISVVPRGAIIADIVKTLADEHIGTLLVMEQDNSLAGIVSERDVIKHLALSGADALELRAEDIMTDKVITCTPNSALEYALEKMSAHSIRHLPVVRDGVPVGIISSRDLLEAQRELLIEDIKRRENVAEAILMSGLD